MNDQQLLDDLFGEMVSSYSRAEAITDGVLVDASVGDLAEVSRQHFKYPIAMTAAVYELIKKAVDHPKHCNDWKGIWHDICWMSKMNKTRILDPTSHLFMVIINGTGRKRNHTLKIVCGPGDNAEPVLTVMMPEED